MSQRRTRIERTPTWVLFVWGVQLFLIYVLFNNIVKRRFNNNNKMCKVLEICVIEE